MKIQEFELYFETFGYSEKDIELMPGVRILKEDSELFVTATIETLKAHSGDKNYMPYYNLLQMYYNKIRWNQ